MFIALTAGFSFAACESDDDFQAGAQDVATKAGAYFEELSSNIELEPTEATEASFTVSRLNTQGALSLPIKVVKNQDDVFEVPASVNFADGEATAVVTVQFAKAEVGNPYTLTVEVPEDYLSLYKEYEGYASYSLTVSRVKWEKLGTCYWVDGNVNTLFGVDALPLAVEVEVAYTPTTTKYRFDSPFAYCATGMDELGIGYIGYPYNEPGDCDEQKHTFLITVTGKEATLDPVELGMDWGYGMFEVGSIYGNLSSNKDAYPLGAPSADGTYIKFPASSLYVILPSEGTYVASNPSYLYLDPAPLMVEPEPDPFQPVGYGYYGYEQFFGWPANYPDYCYLELCQNTQDPSLYRIDGWDLMGGESFFFEMDEDNVITFDDQYTGYTDEELGDIFISNFVETKSYFDWENYEQVTEIVSQSYFDAEKQTFMFNTNYNCELGALAIGYETFEMIEWYGEEEPAEARPAVRGAKKANKRSLSRRPSTFNKKCTVIAPRK